MKLWDDLMTLEDVMSVLMFRKNRGDELLN